LLFVAFLLSAFVTDFETLEKSTPMTAFWESVGNRELLARETRAFASSLWAFFKPAHF